ncbi:MAG: N-acetylmuramoyl-L-alanine amidase AmiC precursor, partial [Pseudomonadota bacterium]
MLHERAWLQRRQVLHMGALSLLLGRAQLSYGASMMAVRIWPAPEYSRVTLESDAPIKTTQTFVADPPRLAVDIEGLQLNNALRELVGKVQANDPN